jgi:ABC-type sulfate transport system permease component
VHYVAITAFVTTPRLRFHQSIINKHVDLPMACPQKVKAKMLHPLVYAGFNNSDEAIYLQSWTG